MSSVIRKMCRRKRKPEKQTFVQKIEGIIQIKLHVVVQSLSHVRLFATPWTAARQASLFFTISQRLLTLLYIELVMPSSHLILCHPLGLLPSIFPSIRIVSNELAPHIRWPKYWISPGTKYSSTCTLGQSKVLHQSFQWILRIAFL